MSVVLAVEPDHSHAEALRKVVKRAGAELMLVATSEAAIKILDRAVPDLVLISALLPPREEDALFSHIRVLEGASHLQTLTIPLLRRGKESAKKSGGSLGTFRKKAPAAGTAGCDPAVFADQIRSYLNRARDVQRSLADMPPGQPIVQPVVVSSRHTSESVAPIEAPVEAPVDEPIAAEHLFELTRAIDFHHPVAETIPLEAEEVSSIGQTLEIETPVPIEQPAEISRTLEDLSFTWLESDRAAAQTAVSAPVSAPVLDEPWISLDIDAAPEPLEAARPDDSLSAQDVQNQLAEEIQRFELRAQQNREDELVRVQAEAQARLTAEVERVQAEAEKRRQHELALLQAEAQEQRQAAVREARAAAEAEARNALTAELEQVRLSEIARVQAEADERCDAVARQAREAAEAEAAQTMTEELARIRAEVEQTLNSQLEYARAEAEQLREAELTRAQAEAASLRDAAAREARLAAEAAANQALETEVARVRADAETRLRAELDVLRQENEHLRRVDQSDAKQAVEKVRTAAVRDARAIADAANQMLAGELAKVRQEADARLEAELARTRDQAERQRAKELEEIRTQVAEMRETASRQARKAAAEAIASEMARSGPAPEPAVLHTPQVRHEPQPTAKSATDYYSLWKPPEPVVVETVPSEPEVKSKRVMAFFRPKWALPAAAALLVVVGNGIPFGWSWQPRVASSPAPVVAPRAERPASRVTEVAALKTGGLSIETSPPGARVILDGVAAGETPLKLTKLKPGTHKLVLQGGVGTLTRRVDVQPGEITRVSESIFSGWLAVFAQIPMNILVGGRFRGTTEDGQLMLTPGTYTVELVSDRFNFRETKHFTIEPGKIASYTVTLPAGVIHVNSPDGTEVSIDGKPAGRTPLDYLSVPIGTHEVAGTSPQFGERRQSVEVKLGEAAEVTLK